MYRRRRKKEDGTDHPLFIYPTNPMIDGAVVEEIVQHLGYSGLQTFSDAIGLPFWRVRDVCRGRLEPQELLMVYAELMLKAKRNGISWEDIRLLIDGERVQTMLVLRLSLLAATSHDVEMYLNHPDKIEEEAC